MRAFTEEMEMPGRHVPAGGISRNSIGCAWGGTMRRKFRPVVALVAMMFAAGFARAEIRERGYEVSLHGGILSGDTNSLIRSTNPFSLRIGFALNPRLMIEGMVSQASTERELTGFAGPVNAPASQIRFGGEYEDTEFRFYTVGLTANFRTDLDVRMIPYMGVGVGLVTENRKGRLFCVDLDVVDFTKCKDVNPDNTLKDPNNILLNPNGVEFEEYIPEQDTGALLSIDAGLRFFATPWLAGKVEIRYYHHDSFERNQDAFEASVGASFLFGGRK